MSTDSIVIKETTIEDLENILGLWNNGDVMFYVGFPQGLGITMKEMKTWYAHLQANKETIKHYSIYTRELGFCGETFYEIDIVNNLAAMDIKLLPKAQGKGLAHYALSYALSQVFDKELALRAYVDPNPDNDKAWALYKKLGFIRKERPDYLEPFDTYLEVTRETFIKKGLPGEKQFDHWAETYDSSVLNSQADNLYPFAGYSVVMECIHEKIKARHVKTILDIGFGTGTFTSKLYNNGYRIYGVDFSSEMLKTAQDKMPDAKLIQGDFTRGLPVELKELTYDCIISTYALHHLTEEEKIDFLHMLKKNLNPGGFIIIGDISFETREQMEEVRNASKKEWDEEEFYMIYSESKERLNFSYVRYHKISFCAGILELAE